ncbi:ABC transporter substrate-binding protein [Desulfosporosinus youngiae]|uniref:ABC-type nitrate/sulfonate/bicarbonate transport system, periplasmic component n=1 Tax=Desulfosporosinus youngiae DSM 17734 TaxID=768710 RepID=H5XRX3_9FIRM|nr:ABC transporter substrate-binding protein [Desulfosporosinus youngiae]EHQ87510.1 ABC-type nitrate/sulfonate/bicarbonate transport system, periplasmic component [Desulfosporosinus youngiae DSM 17734]
MKKKFIVMVVGILMILGLTGCAQTGTDKPTDQAVEKITFVLDWTPNTNHTGVYAAKELGYFQDAGLEVDIIQPPEGGALPLVAAGKAEFTVSFQEEIAAAITSNNPLDVIAVGTILQHNTSGIISLKKDDILSPKDMENKVYATWDTPVEKAILKQVITKDGGNYDNVKMIPNTVTDIISALQSNVDAVWIFYGWDGVATKVKGLDTNFFAFKDIDPVLDFYTPVIAASQTYLNQNGDTAKKFLAAVAKGYEYAIANPEEAAKILVKNAPEVDLDIATASQKYLADQYKAEAKQWGYIDEKRWDNFYTWMYENKLISRKLDSQTGFTNVYLPK